MERVHYNISGLVNSSTKTQLKNALNKIDGVQMVNVDSARGTVEVGYNDATNENAISNCIENMGCHIQ